MDALRQGSLQVSNSILEMQGTKRGSVRKRTLLSCSMPWHCAQCKQTNLKPRRSAGGCSARAASIAHNRIRPSVIAGQGVAGRIFPRHFALGVFGFACYSALHMRGHGPEWRSRGFSGFGLSDPKHGLRTAGTDRTLTSRAPDHAPQLRSVRLETVADCIELLTPLDRSVSRVLSGLRRPRRRARRRTSPPWMVVI